LGSGSPTPHTPVRFGTFSVRSSLAGSPMALESRMRAFIVATIIAYHPMAEQRSTSVAPPPRQVTSSLSLAPAPHQPIRRPVLRDSTVCYHGYLMALDPKVITVRGSEFGAPHEVIVTRSFPIGKHL